MALSLSWVPAVGPAEEELGEEGWANPGSHSSGRKAETECVTAELGPLGLHTSVRRGSLLQRP